MQTSNEEWILALLTAEFAVALAWAFCLILKAPSEEDFLIAHARRTWRRARNRASIKRGNGSTKKGCHEDQGFHPTRA